MMKVCVIGGSGMIGSKMAEHFSATDDTTLTFLNHKMGNSSQRLDITNAEATSSFFAKVKPDIVIHTAALANVDKCERDHHIADLVNVSGTKNVVDGCKTINSRLVYISTSFVFDGEKKAHIENDKCSPSTYYGLTKLRGEELVRDSGLEYLILRTDQPYCWTEEWQHTNSVQRVVHTLRDGKILNEIVDWYNNPTYVPDIVFATHSLLQKRRTGIFHAVGSDFVNRYEWSKTVAKTFGLDERKIRQINSNELDIAVPRPNANLKNTKISKHAGVAMQGVEQGAQAMRDDETPNPYRV